MNCTAKAVLNVHRDSMARFGFSPATRVFEAAGAGHARLSMGRHPSMHRTDSVDHIVLLRGEVTALLDIGEVEMKPFDVLIQRGTNHGWVNHGEEPALLMAVLVDAEPLPR